MAKRKSTGKRERFEIFKRDKFTCQYCGAQPPDVVLVVDHVVPVSKGGGDEITNKITACEPCNQGKSNKELGSIAPRPDADLEWLAMQQEIKEIERYILAKHKRDELIGALANKLTYDFLHKIEVWLNDEEVENAVIDMLQKYEPAWVEEALMNVANKVKGGYIDKWEWKKYIYGMLRNMERER
jgi:hypothetical protein